MYTEASRPQSAGDIAQLYLGIPYLSGTQCVQFWYLMFGDGLGELMVYASEAPPLNVDDSYLWRLTGHQNTDQYTWNFGQVAIDMDNNLGVSLLNLYCAINVPDA